MKRRNADCSKLRRPLKRNRITEGIYSRYEQGVEGRYCITMAPLKKCKDSNGSNRLVQRATAVLLTVGHLE